MRVIAGRLGGRLFESPGTERTHPMSDKMRGALFNVLGDIEGLTVLDPFAGTGALSFEAISRGAALAVALENDKTAQRTIDANIAALELGEDVHLIKTTASAWLNTTPADDTFDLVLCDPPYRDLQPALLKRLTARVAEAGLFILSWPKGTDLPELPHLELVDHRQYGDGSLAFYRRIR